MEFQRTTPLSTQLLSTLKTRIQSGSYSTGERFPSESELCTEFGVSRATVRTALASLSAQGVLVRQAGVGSFVTNQHRLETGLEKLESVVTIAQRLGFTPNISGFKVRTSHANIFLAEKLLIPAGSSLSHFSWTVLVDGNPSSYHEAYLHEGLITKEQLGLFTGSILDILINAASLPIVQARTEITAKNAAHDLSRKLGVPAGTALIVLKETLIDDSGKPVDYSENFYVPERFQLDLVRRRSP
jgi:GntR family transcriptional regulator